MSHKPGSKDGRTNKRRGNIANLTPAKPGETRNPKGINQYTSAKARRRKTMMEECLAWFGEVELVKQPDGTMREMTRNQQAGRLAGRRLLAGLRDIKSIDPMVPHLLNRVWPVPRETTSDNEPRPTNADIRVQINFLDEVRNKTGRNTISVDDVLAALDERIRNQLPGGPVAGSKNPAH